MKKKNLSDVFSTRLPTDIAKSIVNEAESSNVPVSKIVRQRIISGSMPNAAEGNFFVRTKSGQRVPVSELGMDIEIS